MSFDLVYIAGSVAGHKLSDQPFGGQLAGRTPSDLEIVASVQIDECTPFDLEFAADN